MEDEAKNEKKNMKKDDMKIKIILFAVGVLMGAVISTAAFFVYTQTLGTSSSSNGSSMQMPGGGTPPEMPSGDNSGNSQGGTPPEKPSGEDLQSDITEN